MAYVLQIYPDWNIKDYMLVTNVHNLLRYESNIGNRPMTHYVEQPQEIDSVFDDITYSKGISIASLKLIFPINFCTNFIAASVLRMFLLAFGEETFMEGLRLYLASK